jgi:RNA polymerase sigma-70 factor (ECF subfamily)
LSSLLENGLASSSKQSTRKPARAAGQSSTALSLEQERALIEAAQQDRSYFAELYERNFHRLYAYVIVRVKERALAEDIVSEVFQQALANLNSFEWRGVPLIGWLTKIAANAITQHGKRAAREQGEEEIAEVAADDEVERRALLFELVDTLPPDQKRVVVLRFVEERSIREIAQQMGRSEGAVKQLQFRALVNLRDRMEGAHE